MTGKYTPQVSDFSIFKEIASNVSSPLEVIRESISNCDDANANKIIITIDRINCIFIVFLLCFSFIISKT